MDENSLLNAQKKWNYANASKQSERLCVDDLFRSFQVNDSHCCSAAFIPRQMRFSLSIVLWRLCFVVFVTKLLHWTNKSQSVHSVFGCRFGCLWRHDILKERWMILSMYLVLTKSILSKWKLLHFRLNVSGNLSVCIYSFDVYASLFIVLFGEKIHFACWIDSFFACI